MSEEIIENSVSNFQVVRMYFSHICLSHILSAANRIVTNGNRNLGLARIFASLKVAADEIGSLVTCSRDSLMQQNMTLRRH